MSDQQVPKSLRFLTECTVTFSRGGYIGTISLVEMLNPELILQPRDNIISVQGTVPQFLVSGDLYESYPEREEYFSWLETLPEGYSHNFPMLVFTDLSCVWVPFLWKKDCVGKIIVRVA